MKYKLTNKKHHFMKENSCGYSMKSEQIHKAEPFLKWAGGKNRNSESKTCN